MEGTKEKLIAIIEQAQRDANDTIGSMNNGFAVWYADKLIEAGMAPVQGWISGDGEIAGRMDGSACVCKMPS